MGFNEARQRLIEALQAAQQGQLDLLHEDRDDPEKNQLKRGIVSIADVIGMAKRASGGPQGKNYSESPHHDRTWRGVTVHELKRIQWQGGEWYIKWFFDSPNLWFISVHKSTS